MAITIKEIATLAGVGRATVDRALKGREGINSDTRDRILAIAKEYNYKPNTVGKALTFAKNKYSIYVILNSIGNPFFDDIVDGIKNAENEISDYGFCVEYILLKGYDVEEQLIAIDNAYNNGAKAILITPINSAQVSKKLNEIANLGVHIVAVNANIDCDKLTYVGCDYVKSGNTIGSLVALTCGGVANVLVVTGSLNMKGHKERVDGAIDKLKSYNGINIVGVIENNDDEDESYSNVKSSIEKHPNINFLLVTAGGVAGAIKAVDSLNRNIKVVTFDATNIVKELIIKNKIIATVTQQPYEQGYLSLKAIFNYVVKGEKPRANIYTELSIKIKENI